MQRPQLRRPRTVVFAIVALALAAGGTSVVVAATNDPPPVSRAVLALDGAAAEVIEFRSLESLVSEMEIIEHTEEKKKPGETDPVFSTLPGTPKPIAIVLRRLQDQATFLWTWHEAARRGDSNARKNFRLTLFSATGEPVVSYHVQNAFPSKLVLTGESAQDGQLVYETATFTAEFVQRV